MQSQISELKQELTKVTTELEEVKKEEIFLEKEQDLFTVRVQDRTVLNEKRVSKISEELSNVKMQNNMEQMECQQIAHDLQSLVDSQNNLEKKTTDLKKQQNILKNKGTQLEKTIVELTRVRLKHRIGRFCIALMIFSQN